jgi:hypothetical protein
MGFLFEFAGQMVGAAAKSEENSQKMMQARENQKMANQASAEVIANAGREGALMQLQGTKLAARQAVAYSASGVVSSVGSAALAQQSTRDITERDVQMTRNNAAREAWGLRKQAGRFDKEVSQLATTAKFDVAQTGLEAMQSFMGGAAMGMG